MIKVSSYLVLSLKWPAASVETRERRRQSLTNRKAPTGDHTPAQRSRHRRRLYFIFVLKTTLLIAQPRPRSVVAAPKTFCLPWI